MKKKEKQKDQLFREDYFINSIYWMDKPEWLKKLDKASDFYIKEAEKNNKKAVKERTKKFGNKGDHGMVHHSKSIVNDPSFKDLQNWILATAHNLLDEQGFDLNGHKLFLTEMWVQEFSKMGGGHHTLHTHWNGHMSGFYFLKASEKTCPIYIVQIMDMNLLDLYIGISKLYQNKFYKIMIIKNKLNNFVKTILEFNSKGRPADFVENFIKEKAKELRRKKNVIQKK